MAKVKGAWSLLRYVLRHAIRGRRVLGVCPICERRTVFCKEGEWLREQFRCAWYYSIPRFRAIISVLETSFPDWRQMTIHESSPGGVASHKIALEGARVESHRMG